MAGIVRYGSYVPFFRLERRVLGAGKGERAAASYDEDAVSMAVEASREALREAEGELSALLLATTSPAYAEKLNAAIVAAATGQPARLAALDVGGSSRAGATSLLVAHDMAAAGGRVLAAASDVVVGAPGGPREAAGGDGAVAFLFAADDEVVAKVIGASSSTEELLDVWRTPEMPFASQWEERFGAEILLPVLKQTFDAALSSAGLQAGQLSKVIVDCANPRVVRGAASALGVEGGQMADNLAGTVGRCGAAHAGLMLAAALDEAAPGDRLGLITVADGADALVFEVGTSVAKGRPGRSVARWIESRRSDLPYTSYLKWRGILPFEPPRRPDPPRPAAPPMHRAERWKFAFVGSRCNKCEGINLPPQRVCVLCGAVDQMEPVPYADASGKIATYTLDRLAYSLQPPVVAAVVDFEQGGRFSCQLTDVDPETVAIGNELEMTFRRPYTAEGVHNYFWKARPKR